MRVPVCACLLFLATCQLFAATWPNLRGVAEDPFATPAHAHVFLFLRTDCPLANRYAPELNRIAKEYASRSVDFWLVYPDRSSQRTDVEKQIADYSLPGTPLLDPGQKLVRMAGATISPEAAVFDGGRHLTYLGRIDDLVTGFGSSRPAPTTHDLQDAIAQTLEGKPVAHARTRAFGCFLADVK